MEETPAASLRTRVFFGGLCRAVGCFVLLANVSRGGDNNNNKRPHGVKTRRGGILHNDNVNLNEPVFVFSHHEGFHGGDDGA